MRARHPHIGGLILALSADPQSTQAWERGAVGEERVGAVLEKARSRGLEVLHDRRVPGSSANIDHIVVAPTGIWVIDTKRYQGQGVGTRRAGGLFDRRRALVVGGRDKTKLLVGVRRQVDVVAARIDGPWTGIPVFGAICFVDQRNRLAPSFVLDDVLVTQPKQLVASLISTKRRPLTIAPDRVVPLAAEIAGRFPVA